jgi:prepilin-type N-terminal cleavage/methylation domain-containing protein
MLAHRKRAGHGFTLIEVLVVAVVLCVLLGALFAVLGSAREAAARTTCTNQLRQLATAMDMYRQQYGALPPHNYLGTRSTGEVEMITWQEILLPHVGAEEVFLCPSDPETPPMSEQPVWEGRGWVYSGSYEYRQGTLQEDRSYRPREDPDQEEMRRENLSEANVAARHDILLICKHHDRGGHRRTDEGELRPRRCLLAHADCSVTWEPLPEGL